MNSTFYGAQLISTVFSPPPHSISSDSITGKSQCSARNAAGIIKTYWPHNCAADFEAWTGYPIHGVTVIIITDIFPKIRLNVCFLIFIYYLFLYQWSRIQKFLRVRPIIVIRVQRPRTINRLIHLMHANCSLHSNVMTRPTHSVTARPCSIRLVLVWLARDEILLGAIINNLNRHRRIHLSRVPFGSYIVMTYTSNWN